MDDRLVHPPDPAVAKDSALLRAAGAAGHAGRVRDLLDGGWPWPAGEEVELMLWAADYGAVRVIESLLAESPPPWPSPVSEDTARAVLRTARGWVGVEPVAELRRRLGDESGVVERDTVPVDRFTHVERIRVTAADGRWIEVQTAHGAIVTYVEDRLGIVVSRDELLARALAAPDSDSANWVQAWVTVSNRPDAGATLRWAAALLADPQPGVRGFAATVVQSLSFDQQPHRPEALAALRARLPAEADTAVLITLISAFANYHGPGDLPEIVAHTRHPDGAVRTAARRTLRDYATGTAAAHGPANGSAR